MLFSTLHLFANHRGSLNFGKNNTTSLGLTFFLCMSYYDCNIGSVVAIFLWQAVDFVPFQTHTHLYISISIYNTLNGISYILMRSFFLVANKFIRRLSVNMICNRLCYSFRDKYCKDACKFVLCSV